MTKQPKDLNTQGALDQKVPNYVFRPIGFVRSPFRKKHGVPRQSVMASQVKGEIWLDPEFPDLGLNALRRIEGFSHLWIVFVFHEHGGKKWKPSIRPPRLGGREKVGVLASRSPHRPNPIGISAVEFHGVKEQDGKIILKVAGLDLLDGTPVLDIKPYLPYADSIPEASAGWASEEIPTFPVRWEKEALDQFAELAKKMRQIEVSEYESESESVRQSQPMQNQKLSRDSVSEFWGDFETLKELVNEVLSQDPRPGFQKREHPVGALQSEGLSYGICIGPIEVKFQIQNGGWRILSVWSAAE